MARQTLQTISVAEAATAQLRETIFSGAYKAGEEIKDTRIAEEYGIARPTARIAVQQLIAEGMLVREPGYSARVRTFDPSQVRDLFRVRKLIEIDSIRYIKEMGSDLSEVEQALQQFRELGEAPRLADIAKADAAFHGAVVRAGASSRLTTYFEGIANEIRLLLALPEKRFGRGASPFEEHEELFLLLSGDTQFKELKAAWTFHLDESRDYLINHLNMFNE